MIAFRSGYSLPHSRFRFARSSSLQGICRHVLTFFADSFVLQGDKYQCYS